MNGKNSLKQRLLAGAVWALLIAAPGCSSHEIELPMVKEESLTPEQKTQLDRVRNAQAEAFKKSGVKIDASNPAAIAQQRYEEQTGSKPVKSTTQPADAANQTADAGTETDDATTQTAQAPTN